MSEIPQPKQEDDEDFDLNLVKAWTEYQGRQQRLLPPQFAENEIVAGPYPLNVNLLGAGFVPSFPNLDAIIVAPDGERIQAKGGYIHLAPGRYKIYYVDRQERYMTLPEVQAVTLDGANVSFSCGITFRVNDSMQVQNIRNPMDALFKACEAALRHVIRTHKHDELIDEKADNEEPGTSSPVKILSDEQIAAAVKMQVNMSEACRAFNLHNVNIIDRQGHLRLLGVREEEAVRLRTGRREIKQIDQRTELSKRQKLLTDEQGKVIEQQAQNETRRRQILFEAEKLAVELERMRKLPQFSHQEYLKIIDARIEALKMLMQAQAMPGSSRNINEVQTLVEKIINEMPNIAEDLPEKPSSTNQANRSNDEEFIELLIPKKKKKPPSQPA